MSREGIVKERGKVGECVTMGAPGRECFKE